MNTVVAGVGIFNLEPTHKICQHCPYSDIEINEERFFDGEELVTSAHNPKCKHTQACMRVYRKCNSTEIPV